MTKLNLALLLATGWLVGAASAFAMGSALPPQIVCHTEVQPDRTLLRIDVAKADSDGQAPTAIHRLVALPPGISSCQAIVTSGQAGAVAVSEIARLRGIPVVSVVIQEPGDNLEITIQHDGDWAKQNAAASRLRSPTFKAGIAGQVSGLPDKLAATGPRGYVIITTDDYLTSANLLADWKRQKGLEVTVASMSSIGSSGEDVRSWLQTAYENWSIPPEYVLLLGDIGDVPSWNLGQNYTDHVFACVDGDDWLPDLKIGRLPVNTTLQAETVVARTIQYERAPYVADRGWFTRTLALGGNYPATTPVATVRWCADQLESIGFTTAAEVMFDPTNPDDPDIFNGIVPITNALEDGAGMVLYRGWAHGPEGWEPPRFLVPNVAGVDNTGMTPIIFSFVCYTAKFYASSDCLGEAFLHHGSPTDLKGAVAFYGNNEAWSHTRYNDAMAIAFFELVDDLDIVDMGAWAIASKLRFMDFFPNELYAADQHDPEESVEFYFYIYHLLGDPELCFWRSAPDPLTVSHAGVAAPGANLIPVQVHEEDGITPVADARVGIVHDGQLLGTGSSDISGLANVPLRQAPSAGDTLEVTVTRADRLAEEFTLVVGDGSAAYLVLATTTLDDDSTPPSLGNGNGQANPGESLELGITLHNHGLGTATGVTGDLLLTGPARIINGQIDFPDAPGSQDVTSLAPFVIQVDSTAVDGCLIQGVISATHDGGVTDESHFEFTVRAPTLTGESVTITPDGQLEPGVDHTLTIALHNEGNAATAGGTLTLSLANPDAGTLTDATATFGPLAPGESRTLDSDTFGLQVADDLAIGSGVTCYLDIMTTEGYRQESSLALIVGQIDVGAPVGPDKYGYHAIDSIDIDYPAQRPEYHWRELSPTYGGTGTRVDFPSDYTVQLVDLPFTFKYYGQSFNRMRVSDNGYVSFDLQGENDFYNWPIPSEFGDHSIVAPFWDNFHPDPEDHERPRPDGIFTLHDEVAGTFTIEWSRVSHYRTEFDDRQTFQVVLYDPGQHPTTTGDGEIVFLYKQVTNVDHLRQYATVGIESPDESDGLQLTYANLHETGMAPLAPGLAIKITTERPIYDPLQLAAFAAVPATDGMRLTWTPADDRPVTGWNVFRLEGGEAIALNSRPLPAATREFLDRDLTSGESCAYRIVALHPHGLQTDLGSHAAPTGPAQVNRLALRPCWPNPMKDTTSIGFAIPRGGTAKLRIYDVAGRLVKNHGITCVH